MNHHTTPPESISMDLISHPFFNFEEQQHPVRIFGSAEEPWFCAADVGTVLGLTNIRMSLDAVDPEDRRVSNTYTSTGGKDITLINESGLYALIFKSRKPQAKTFRKWVTGEVLPALRRTGSYTVPGAVTTEALSQITQSLSLITQSLGQHFTLTTRLMEFAERTTAHQQATDARLAALEARPHSARPRRTATSHPSADYHLLAGLCIAHACPHPGQAGSITLETILHLADTAGLLQHDLPPHLNRRSRLTTLGYRLRQIWPHHPFPHPQDKTAPCQLLPREESRLSTWIILPN